MKIKNIEQATEILTAAMEKGLDEKFFKETDKKDAS
jgi:hypothetical protein